VLLSFQDAIGVGTRFELLRSGRQGVGQNGVVVTWSTGLSYRSDCFALLLTSLYQELSTLEETLTQRDCHVLQFW
jgi:hypothetical protein